MFCNNLIKISFFGNKFIDTLLNLDSPTINGDGSFSRDFTHIENVVQMNLLAISIENELFIIRANRNEKKKLGPQ